MVTLRYDGMNRKWHPEGVGRESEEYFDLNPIMETGEHREVLAVMYAGFRKGGFRFRIFPSFFFLPFFHCLFSPSSLYRLLVQRRPTVERILVHFEVKNNTFYIIKLTHHYSLKTKTVQLRPHNFTCVP